MACPSIDQSRPKQHRKSAFGRKIGFANVTSTARSEDYYLTRTGNLGLSPGREA